MGLFDKLYSGNGRKAYSPEDMPETRMELVKLILKDHFANLIPMNLLYLLIFLPGLFWGITGFFYIMEAMGTDGTLVDFLSLSKQWVLIMAPCCAITGPFVAAMSIVQRNLARDDYRQPKGAFLSALKECWKPALLLSVITGCIPIILWAAAAVYVPMLGRMAMLPVLLLVLASVIWLLMLPTLQMMLSTYQLPLRKQIKNAFLLTMSRFPLVAGVHLLMLLPALLLAAGFLIGGKLFAGILFVCCVYYLLCGFALTRLMFAFVSNYLTEEFLNPQIEGAGIRIGMKPKKK